MNKLKNIKNESSLLEQYKELADMSLIISKTNLQGIITYVNSRFCQVSGYSESELLGQNHNIIRNPTISPLVFKDMWRVIKQEKKTWKGVITNLTKSGEIYYVKTIVKPILDEDGEILEFIASRILITDIIHPRKQLSDFLRPMDESIVVLIKIEDFKYIDRHTDYNLNLKMQKEFSQRLYRAMPKESKFTKIYLLEKGEFVIALDKKKCLYRMNTLIHKLKQFQRSINREKVNMGYIDYELSIVVSFAYGKDALRDAKVGLKRLLYTKQDFIVANGLAKEREDQSKKSIETFRMIKKAIDSCNIVSYFQPIINNKTKEIEKYESLVRLIDENKNILSPYFFLDVSKKGKYYSQITSIVLENSFKALHETDTTISINLSALDIEKKETRNKFFALLKRDKREASRVILELVEDENITEFKTIVDFIEKVKSLGVRIAIDDFGVGYSTFERVLDYKPDFLKIDGRLIKNIHHDKLAYSIVESIVSFSKKENLQTIAEYVESEEIYDILCHLGVDYSQGYYVGKPDTLEKNGVCLI